MQLFSNHIASLDFKLPTIKIENELAIRFPVGKHHNLTIYSMKKLI